MSRSLKVREDQWTVVSTGQPQIAHYCSNCKQLTAFQSSDKIRLNSQGKKLDAWLIHHCVHCEQVWNRPILERVVRKSLSNQNIKELEQSHPDLVEKIANDPGSLPIWTESETEFKAHSDTDACDLSLPLRVHIHLIGFKKIRLDRLVAKFFNCSRSKVQRAMREQAILTKHK